MNIGNTFRCVDRSAVTTRASYESYATFYHFVCLDVESVVDYSEHTVDCRQRANMLW